ncbi:MAG: response regulator [Anaerolineales bacterium]|nr:MAG: response regulator [Chloroflexota bacterium]MBE7436368.1 response regulator [Anaerolineales bacterium]MCE7861220.1 response regulator [Chloroflexi bacterium CFX2]MCK6583686.1 response regulator [Anaerolineales bacterium]GJQ34324.1 MAG: response regulator [Anaerolineaceae bacterium]
MKEIWIIDDDDEMAQAISLMLKVLDYQSKHFNHPRPAAQLLLSGKRPDLMILDINMPEVTGLDMLEFMRRRPEWKRLPVIMLSSEAADVMVDKALKLGADGYVMKPVTIEELEKAMAQAFYKHIER